MIRLVPTGPAHAAVISALLGHAFPDGWDEKSVGEILAMPGTWGWIALKEQNEGQAGDEAPTGVILIQAAADQGDIITLAVHPDHRREDIASRLLERAKNRARDIGLNTFFLEVSTNNAPARAFYDKHGFIESGIRKEYYREINGRRTDAIVLKSVF